MHDFVIKAQGFNRSAQVDVGVKRENREKGCLRCNSVVKEIGSLTTKKIKIIEKNDMSQALRFLHLARVAVFTG